jgi:hypothetical protein
MKDIRGVPLQNGDLIVSGQRSGSGSGYLVIREVVEVHDDHTVYVKSLKRGNMATAPRHKLQGRAEVLIVPSDYRELL